MKAIIACAVLSGLIVAEAADQPSLQWDFWNPDEVVSANNLATFVLEDGMASGTTAWDPYLTVRLPGPAITAGAFAAVEARLFSSAPADHFAVYYRTAGGDWALGVIGKVEQGWNTYALPVVDIQWVSDASSPEARTWGGRDGQITTLRIDPGNQEKRELRVDYLRLVAAPSSEQAQREGQAEAPGWEALLLPPEGWRSEADGGTMVADANGLMLSANAGQTVSATSTAPLNRPGHYVLTVQPRADSSGDSLRIDLEFADIFGQTLDDRRNFEINEHGAGAAFSLRFTPPARAASVSVGMTAQAEDAARTWVIAEVRLSLEEPLIERRMATTRRALDNWQASWTGAEREGSPLALRREFVLADHGQVRRALAMVSGAGATLLHVNGQTLPAGPFYRNPGGADVYDIKPYLRQGTNVVGVACTGAVAIAEIEVAGAETLHMTSDSSWQAAVEAQAGWASPEFDASGWTRARIDAPAGDSVNYPVRLGLRNRVEVTALEVAEVAKAGTALPIRARLAPQSVVAPEPAGLIEIQREGDAHSLPVWRGMLPALTEGTPVDFQVEVALPRYLPPGEYRMRLLAAQTEFTAVERAESSVAQGEGAMGFRLAVAAPEHSPLPAAASFAWRDGWPQLSIGGESHPPMHIMVNDANPYLIENCRNAGFHLYWLNVRTYGWRDGGQHEFALLDKACTDLLLQDPKAHILLNLPLDPVNNAEMRPWMDAHPEDAVQDETGNTNIEIYHGARTTAPAFMSEAWQTMAEETMRTIVRHVRGSSYADRVIGYAPISGVTWEWQYWGSVGSPPAFVDYGPASRRAFADWAIARYGAIGAVAEAWGMNLPSADAIAVPSRERRTATDYGSFLDPARSRYVIDWRRFFNGGTAQAVLRMARAVKEESDGQSLCGTYYGYVTHVLNPHRYQVIGHFALGDVLASPDIDFLMSPSNYGGRDIGGASGFMSTVDSLRLHNKYWIDQADLRTVNAVENGERVTTLADSKAVIQRHFANALISGVASQWYDFSLGWMTGDPRLMEVIGRCREIEQELRGQPRPAPTPTTAMAVLVDERSVYYTGSDTWLHHDSVFRQIDMLYRSGAAFDLHLLDDLERMPEYRCYLFLNCYRLNAAQRAFINDSLKSRGNTLLFVGPCGITDELSLDTGLVADATGFGLAALDAPAAARVAVTPGGDPLLRYVHGPMSYGAAQAFAPVLYPTDGAPLGMLEASAQAGFAVKRHDAWTAIFSSAPVLPPDLIRGIASAAGIHVYNESSEDATYAQGNMLAVHTLEGGPRRLRIPGAARVRELFTDIEYSATQGAFDLTLEPRTTYLFCGES